MPTLQVLATLFLGLTIVLCGGVLLRSLMLCAWRDSRVEEIRRLRLEGLAVNQDGEA